MSKKSRPLALKIYFKIPKSVSEKKIKDTLIESVESGRYRLPRGWRVVLAWRNRGKWKNEEWSRALSDSAQSSTGFDKAVLIYLENL